MKALKLLFTILIFSFISKADPIDEGKWKGIIHYKTVDIPFTFNLKSTSDTTVLVTLINGVEEIHIDNAILKGDSIFIPMHVFDAEIKAIFKNGKMSGEWHKNYKKIKGPLFTAIYAEPRFFVQEQNHRKVTSNWEITFTQPNGQTSQAIGSFANIEDNKATGTILTEVGDFRFFEGILFGDSIRMSSFDGAHGFLILGKYSNGGWHGEFHYEYGYSESWNASPNADASLTDPFELFTVKPSTHKPYYDILTAGGEYNAIDSDMLEDKVVIIQLMGTWCPNSLDQTNYLIDWYKTQDKDKVEMIAVTYEPGNKTYAQKRIDDYSRKLQLPYPIYIGGSLSKGQAALAFPNLNKINAFPTLIMIDKQGYIRYINSYFNGPATGKKYQQFDEAFNDKLKKLLAE